MSKSPAVKLSEGYAQFWPLQQSQPNRVSTVECIHLDDFIEHAAQDRPTRASSGGKEGNLWRFIRLHFWHENSDTQHIYYDSNKG